tara:strand:+ start:2459 stop:3025 length:567 start_codon:yes stop_codon:yes gene_type:complete
MDKFNELQMFYKRRNPLSSLAAYAAGWALSDSLTKPRDNMTPSQRREWDRAVDESVRRKYMRNFKKDDMALTKDHAPIPPRQGLSWDPVKKRWTRPENIGHSVTEVQGKKRIRGTGTGIHEHSLAVGRFGGKGAGSAEAGRRFRSATDSGVVSPHDTKHASMQHLRKPSVNALKRLIRRHRKNTASAK